MSGWDKAIPAGSDELRTGDDSIRQNKIEIENALNAYGKFPHDADDPRITYIGQTGNTAARPTNGEGGIYFDTETQELLRDTGAAWERIGINFPDGTRTIWMGPAAPLGWSAVTGVDGRMLYVDSTSGPGTTASSSWATQTSSSSGAHTHIIGYAYIVGSSVGIQFVDSINSGDGVTIYMNAATRVWETPDSPTRCSASGTYSGVIHGDSVITQSVGNHTHTIPHTAAQHTYVSWTIYSKDATT